MPKAQMHTQRYIKFTIGGCTEFISYINCPFQVERDVLLLSAYKVLNKRVPTEAVQ
jgi:hypothetical protein